MDQGTSDSRESRDNNAQGWDQDQPEVITLMSELTKELLHSKMAEESLKTQEEREIHLYVTSQKGEMEKAKEAKKEEQSNLDQ
eukprot:4452961-Amphidinium_carterae.3